MLNAERSTFARRAASLPLFGLAPGGVCRAASVTGDTGELLPHRFTLTAGARGTGGGLFSVALSLGSLPLGVTQHPALVELGLSSGPVSRPAITRTARVRCVFIST